MSLIKANAVQIGQSTTATQNFTLAVPSSPDGTIKLARGNSGATTQDVLSVDASGNINGLVKATGSTTARSLANRFADVVNILDFGADPTGILDCSPALTLALSAAGINGVIFVPKGTYKISNTVDLTYVSMVGEGWKSKFITTISSGKCFTIQGGGGTAGTYYKDFSIYGNASADYGISCTNTIGNIAFENIYFTGFTKSTSVALRFGNCWNFDVSLCHFVSNVNDIAGQQLTTELNPIFSTANMVNSVVIKNCKFEESTGKRISNEAGYGFSISNCFFGGTCTDVIYFGGNTTSQPTYTNEIIHNDIESNATNAAISFIGNSSVGNSYNHNVCFNRITQNINIFAGNYAARIFFINNFFPQTLTSGKLQFNFANSGAIEIREPVFNSTYTLFNSGAYNYIENVGNITCNSISVNGITVGAGSGGINTNTVIGKSSLNSNTIGINNTASGVQSLYSNTIGNNNNAYGQGALYNNINGSNNSAFGSSALLNNTTFSNIGGFGYDAQVTGSNQIQLGDSATTTYAYGAVQNRSDIRDKTDVRDTTLGIDFVNALRPVDFKWDLREDYRPEAPKSVAKPSDLKEDASDEDKAKYAEELAAYNAYVVLKDKWLEDVKLANITHDGSQKRNRYHHGLIAQEVKAVLDAKGIDFGGFQDHKVKGGDDVLSIGYEEFIAPLIKAVQELSAKVTALESK